MSAAQTLQRQFRDLQKNGVPGFKITLVNDNIFEWEVGMVGPPDTLYQGGYFRAVLKFPTDYPFNPPSFTFTSDMFHPNVYPDGKLCISILHPPGDDPMSGETAQERWNPTQSVESILLSVVSLLSDPNASSPANLDAGVMWRNDRKKYEQIVKMQVEQSKKDIPEDLDGSYVVKPPVQHSPVDDDDFWNDEDYEDDEEEDEED
ncbi:putative ubiquitin conjugating enzyme [Gorgonomyces haynaldii]|nr:putative ubiquitin conjugating enzyme [Gorgonomyces haynaldii]